ncbi:hypothetical protein D5R81_04215 [Parashewanella spongiae]|uniref:Uncharacterized protein n=1 Tax=Parashewanella spongiae TaxID=342950 RepID=A0A3A6U087_9GAMM|nr:hypothetical protein [Parashewanella spongiae]MCL1077216.1 hypothetical protein [Parashewanella spongiae]RJY18705.1 hypothetical protein D5R81_04215 [Parashewanella spongiae]
MFIRIILALFLFLISATASAVGNMKVYSCDDCDFDRAKFLASFHPPRYDCIGKPPGFPPRGSYSNPYNEYPSCDPVTENVIFANPLTRIAYKFKVTVTPDDLGDIESIIVNSISLSYNDTILLNKFYDIDEEFRSAMAQDVVIIENSNSPQYSYSSVYRPNSNSSDSCDNHPISFFKNRGRERIYDRMTADISAKVGDSDWNDYYEDTDFTGGGLNLSRDGFGFNVSFVHNTVGAFAHYVVGDHNNTLDFEVSYGGVVEINGSKSLRLSYKLNKGSSRIDGITVGNLFADTTQDLTPSGTAVSNCLLEYLEENSETISSVPFGGGDPDSGSGDGIGDGDDGGNNINLCTKTVKATVCNSQSGQCTTTIFRFVRPCN